MSLLLFTDYFKMEKSYKTFPKFELGRLYSKRRAFILIISKIILNVIKISKAHFPLNPNNTILMMICPRICARCIHREYERIPSGSPPYDV